MSLKDGCMKLQRAGQRLETREGQELEGGCPGEGGVVVVVMYEGGNAIRRLGGGIS